MEVIDYINNNLDHLHGIHGGNLLTKVTKNSVTPFPVYTGRWSIGDKHYACRNISNIDIAITSTIPNERVYTSSVWYIVNWLESKLFNYMLLNACNIDTRTELTRLRIGVSMIFSLSEDTLTIDQKRMWSDWIKDLYWTRKRAITDWRLKYIDNIPF